MNGDDVRDWEATGVDPRADPSSRWRIFIDEDGVADWELDEEVLDFGDSFFLQGSHSNWEPVEMERHDEIEGLWVGQIIVGSEGEVEFQVMADKDVSKVFHPGQRRCTLKASTICGPERVSKEMTWVIQGRPGETF
eukprot:UN4837